MPRSGSSLLAGVIHGLGVPMGDPEGLARGRHLNRFGCFEDQEFQRISLNTLFEAGLLLDLPARLDAEETRLADAVERRRPEIERFVARRSGASWGFKDPGLIYSLPHMCRHFENPRYLHLRRDTADTAASWYRTFRPRFWLPELRAKWRLLSPVHRIAVVTRVLKLLVAHHRSYGDHTVFADVIEDGHRRIEAFLEGSPHMRVELPELVECTDLVVDRIAAFLELSPTADARAAATAFVHPELLTGR